MARTPDQIPMHHLFAHNAWATEQLLAFCEGLSEEQMSATAPGAVGTVSETLHHIVQAECGYFSRASGGHPAHWQPHLEKSFEAVKARAEELGPLWLAFAATDPDASELRRKVWPDVTHEFPAAMEIVQALQHAHSHREQICTILTSIGLQPPDLQGLKWADEKGMLRRIR